MDNTVKKILEDLYAVDVSLKQYEAVLEHAITGLLASRPHAQLDEQFKQELRAELLRRIELLKKEPPRLTIWAFIQQNTSALAAIATIAAVAVGLSLYNPPSPEPFKQSVVQRDAQAFGPIAMSIDNAKGIIPEGRGGVDSTPLSESESVPVDAPLPVGKMIAPNDLTAYEFVYTGKLFEIGEGEQPVYRRIKSSPASFQQSLNTFGFGAVDLGTFRNKKIQSLSFVEDTGKGYMVSIDVQNESIGISQNWPQWATAMEEVCGPVPCAKQSEGLKPEQLLESSQAIAIARSFVEQHHIDASAYGEPELMMNWGEIYAATPDKSMLYIPDTMEVVYPMIVEGNTVVDESGRKTGFNVSVNTRAKEVVGLWSLTSQKYESSLYPVETDVNRILALAKEGSVYGNLYPPEAQIRRVQIKIGTPEKVYLRTWIPGQEIAQELILPALKFPIIDENWQEYMRPSIVIPIAKTALENTPQPPVRIMQ